MVDASPAYRVAREIQQHGLRVGPAVARVVRHHGQLLVTRVKAKARGRPGPRMVTGDYNRSWGGQFGFLDGGPTFVAGTNNPQGRRLEFGFEGEDSLGHYYDQPPFPHAGPAVDETEPGFVRDLGDAAAGGWLA